MDNRDLEKLMDRYKKEMMEFSRKNADSRRSGEGSGPSEASQETSGGKPVSRDRRDPFRESRDDAPPKPETKAEKAQTADSVSPDLVSGTTVDIDVRRNLIAECERITDNPNATREQIERCREISEFLATHKESGLLRVETFASDRVFGIVSARVVVFLPLPSGNITVFDGLTNMNGETGSIRLPTPAKALSLTPNNNGILPYSVYTIYVEHPGYTRSAFGNVPVFSETESIQPVQMLAAASDESGVNPFISDESIRNSL